jgi:hypothetical protein
MKNVGIDIFKPDRHVRRLLFGIGLIHSEFSPVQEMCAPMLWLSESSKVKIGELDTFLFTFGAMTGDRIAPLRGILETQLHDRFCVN